MEVIKSEEANLRPGSWPLCSWFQRRPGPRSGCGPEFFLLTPGGLPTPGCAVVAQKNGSATVASPRRPHLAAGLPVCTSPPHPACQRRLRRRCMHRPSMVECTITSTTSASSGTEKASYVIPLYTETMPLGDSIITFSSHQAKEHMQGRTNLVLSVQIACSLNQCRWHRSATVPDPRQRPDKSVYPKGVLVSQWTFTQVKIVPTRWESPCGPCVDQSCTPGCPSPCFQIWSKSGPLYLLQKYF